MKEIYPGIFADDVVGTASVDILFNALDDILVTDAAGRIIMTSQKAAENFGVPIEKLVGSMVADLVEAGVYNHSTVLECLRTRKTASGLGQTQRKLYFYSTTKPFFDKDGTLLGTITNTRDHGLLQTFTKALEEAQQNSQKYAKLARHLQNSDGKNDVVIAVSSAMQQIRRVCEELSDSDSTMLITGETGTGKEVLARSIYQRSRRNGELFVPVNCGSIPAELMESELFGYERGAFTGANPKGHIGLIEMANHGTLFLDEIGEIPKSLQSKLLRFLEGGEIRHVGSSRSIQVDVRVICATNRDLHRMVREGKFREDLYYRINVVPIELPPLRHRPEDILPLAEHFLQHYNQKYGKQVTLSPAAAEQLTQYVWPGNIRELRNIIERMVVTADISGQLPLSLPKSPFSDIPDMVQPPAAAAPAAASEPIRPLREARSAFEADYIAQAIRHCGGNITQAARQLGVDRTLIYKKMRDPEPQSSGGQ